MEASAPPGLVLVSTAPPPAALTVALREGFPDLVPAVAGNEPALRAALASNASPLLLCDLASPAMPVEAIARLLRELDSPARLLALGGDGAPGAVMARGARDLVSLKDPQHLKLVLARELDILPAWRERHIGVRPEEAAEALMEGDELNWANEAFARLLGRNSATQIARRAIWVCIDGEDHHLLRRALHSAAAGHSRPAAPLQVRAVGPDGRRLRLAVTLNFERTGDKPMVRLHAGRAPDGDERAPPQINVETLKRLRAAMNANSLAIAVQPITALAAHEVEDVMRLDVLIRVRDAAGEMAASEFMREASAAGLLKLIDHWVVRHTSAMAAKATRPTLHFLRIARQTLQDPSTLAVVRAAIAQNKIQPAQLSFEMTESELVGLFPDERALLYALKKDGARLTLSQFGARPESLETLDRLPLDYIKLDIKLTGAVATDAARQKVSQLVQRAAAHNIRTIAAQVVDAMSLAELWKLGVHYVQGYYVHEPEIVVGA